ncbi:Asp-tRNA(Asn)/Glu-tRNA(Gln) amidotransferase GatCAB subunit C [bacterium (Candidatus Blackallbacteria) CG17_big_fil_post_rev_8_21_14_2_50_48_46]|uniref:Aspartyl/glutamyl-tRNA(Asn/Gln) amidotransferase subunit C n=1 Tax=bacterium (Candidatus Blackallbacteria) CG17_big_fil_post_rev_8_21_14_2_50_48_46 TaxID=2014261 RepID=A0A2M7GAZ3_9BACT|nr:MAG: Asp-tRNA(Asn)/Glu-tRNA(Gln) amidotransferase GatCAB subunit C [bacterium (Candidatus Blackallbacteria) CG18_big_fil_WC_8_21_14_2_50_49_26]PIW19347.1 MAG: Asp-tRNA(Asn)/Glu-tRNA(Gln) amidotransferase GatCAB subunit C [bacterium (Candidatus Blackallbacteria) CG17_big_fil_post_rev_8_21_14_2_50_48_46]PIW49049.1 MAG: Asp-tRNA(Asn)/Glu-tRNA(Gln) amidotransferase GatCAB subunit C [bacterium (Candidatus Blackallbacteria) CG13_big_fil_rev_8_21_14_2_50_49_14]
MITSETIRHIAKLSRLSFSEPEIERLKHDLATVLDYVDQLAEVDTEGVEPACHSLSIKNVYRNDKVRHSLSSEQVFQNAPETEDAYFKVPQIMGQA